MNSNDIVKRVRKQMKESGSSLIIRFGETIDKEKIIQDFQTSIFDYTSEKLLEVGNKEDLVYDLGFLFDKLEPYLGSEKQKQDFYSNYVYMMLEVYGNLEQKAPLWNEEEQYNTLEYPKFENKNYICYLKTDPKVPTKETAIWIFSYLDKQYIEAKKNIKK